MSSALAAVIRGWFRAAVANGIRKRRNSALLEGSPPASRSRFPPRETSGGSRVSPLTCVSRVMAASAVRVSACNAGCDSRSTGAVAGTSVC